jgi:hypothetical protein
VDRRSICTDQQKARIALAPIKAVPSVGACLSALDYQEGAIAVVLDVMDPLWTLRRLIDWGGKLRLDETEPLRCARHGLS